MTSRMGSYAKVLRVSREERRLLLRAQRALVAARLMLWRRATGRLVEPAIAPTGTARVEALPVVRRRALAVRRAAVFGLLRPTCLEQSIALQRMLEADGLAGARVRVGVRQRAGEVQAHAWVEYAGEVVGDFGEHVATFTELTDVRVLPGAARWGR